LDAESSELKVSIARIVGESGSGLVQITGVSTLVAARILGEVGDVRRFASKNQFASAPGTSPIPASSGQVQRHRLNRGGNRRLNRAIHTVALVQARFDPLGRAYVLRRRAEGKTWREAIRCLKRHLANRIYRQLVLDVDDPTTASPGLDPETPDPQLRRLIGWKSGEQKRANEAGSDPDQLGPAELLS
jgi:transposase